jgi:hypothetical protein
VQSGDVSPQYSSSSLGLREVYGIKLNNLEEPGEIEIIGVTTFNHDSSAFMFECEFAFSRHFSLEVEIPGNFSSPVFSGCELNGTFSLVRNKVAGFYLLVGCEFFIPWRKSVKFEAEPYIGIIKYISNFAMLGKLLLGNENEKFTRASAKEETEVSLAIGPYFQLSSSLIIGVPLNIAKETDDFSLRAGLDVSVRIAKSLSVFGLLRGNPSNWSDWMLACGFFLEMN